MTSLRDLQLGLARAIRGGDASRVAASIRADGLAPVRRLAIYANNVRETFLGTLEATFPVLCRLAGRDWLRQTGRRYLREAPSRHGNLHFVGERFAAWLGGELAGSAHAWFVDVVRLEWAYQEALVAPEPPPFDPATLATLPPEHYEALVLEPNPTLQLVDSPFPLLAIWRANQAGVEEPPVISLDAGASRVGLVRRADHVELRELDPATYAIAGAVLRRQPLALAFAAASDAGIAGDDLARALASCLAHGYVSGWQCEPLPAPDPFDPSRSTSS